MNKEYILKFIASLCLCDHMGDVADDIDKVLMDIDFEVGEWNDLSELLGELAKHNITTLYGTEITND